MTSILGLNAYHGFASAAIVVDGKLIAAVEEERFNRIKHWAGFPAQSIRYCLEQAGVDPRELDHVAISFDPRANFLRRLGFVLSHFPSPRAIIDRVKRQGKTLGLVDQFASAVGCQAGDLRAKFHRIEHHQTHVAAGFLISPFEEAAILSIDGMGDFHQHAHGLRFSNIRGGTWTGSFFRIRWVTCTSAMTMYLGFPHFGDEYKVMGLTLHSEPEFADVIRRMVRPREDVFELDLAYFTHHKHGIRMTWNNGAPPRRFLSQPAAGARLRPDANQRRTGDAASREYRQITASCHRRNRAAPARTPACEDQVAEHLHDRRRGDELRRQWQNYTATPFEKVYVPAGAQSNGTSFGAAFYVWNRVLGHSRSFIQDHAYWGCAFDQTDCAVAIRAAGETPALKRSTSSDLVDRTTDLLLDGKVAGWFSGRMEFRGGPWAMPRASGRSAYTDMQNIINLP